MGLIERLKDARRKSGMTQEDVERESGIKAKTISNWENGVSRPDIDSVVVLCRLYKVDPNELFEWTESEKDNEEWTVSEEQEIENFKEYLRSKKSRG